MFCGGAVRTVGASCAEKAGCANAVNVINVSAKKSVNRKTGRNVDEKISKNACAMRWKRMRVFRKNLQTSAVADWVIWNRRVCSKCRFVGKPLASSVAARSMPAGATLCDSRLRYVRWLWDKKQSRCRKD